MKVGDNVNCFASINHVISAGKCYKIINIDYDGIKWERFTILDDSGLNHHFTFDRYSEWLLTTKEHRKLKLKKINESTLY